MTFEDRSGRITHSGPTTLWRQIADDIAADIDSGVLGPGWKIPAEADLAEVYGVARNTVRRAIRELIDDGKLVSVHGRGTFVTD